MADRPFLPFALPDIGPREKAAVAEVLDSGWITTGPRTKRFEGEFATRVGAPHAVALNSCTAALHLALEAIGVGPGDEVVAPTMTFAATGEVVRYLGAKPVLVDVHAADHNMDPAAFEKVITARTKAVIPVHYAGKACGIDELIRIAHARGITVIEDAAHAFPTRVADRMIGSIGDITCFSFYATKTLTTGEGGMLTTARDDWADRVRVMSLHGISKDAWKRYTAEGSWYYEIVAPGYKYNLTDIASALGLVQLERADELLVRRRAIARRYLEAFASCDAIETLDHGDFDAHAWHLFVIRLRPDTLTIDRNAFIERLRAAGIGTSVHFIPLHLHPYYRDTFGYGPEDLPVAHDCYRRLISLPIYPRMTDADVGRVIDAVLGIVTTTRR